MSYNSKLAVTDAFTISLLLYVVTNYKVRGHKCILELQFLVHKFPIFFQNLYHQAMAHYLFLLIKLLYLLYIILFIDLTRTLSEQGYYGTQ